MNNTPPSHEVIEFLRKKDYKFVKELGEGACGKTILLFDDLIGEHFVCKKYSPYDECQKQALFDNFVSEIKLLHQVHHDNVVRVFNYYLYPESFAGYLLMEYIDGDEIDVFLENNPEQTNEVFLQAISGFSCLERASILHRDIRPMNIMVCNNGMLKIIDLGFGKRVTTPADFNKSISLNWWVEPPGEFSESKYDFATEVYFVGKLFHKIIQEKNISHFKYSATLRKMCLRDPGSRISSFTEIERTLRSDQFSQIEFTSAELKSYRDFGAILCEAISKIENGAKYKNNIVAIGKSLDDAHRGFMLEQQVPDSAVVLRCFIDGGFFYNKNGMEVEVVLNFIQLLKGLTEEKRRIVLANLHTKLDSIERYPVSGFPDSDDVPF